MESYKSREWATVLQGQIYNCSPLWMPGNLADIAPTPKRSGMQKNYTHMWRENLGGRPSQNLPLLTDAIFWPHSLYSWDESRGVQGSGCVEAMKRSPLLPGKFRLLTMPLLSRESSSPLVCLGNHACFSFKPLYEHTLPCEVTSPSLS